MLKNSILSYLLLLAGLVQAQTNVIDFTSPDTKTFGEAAQVEQDGMMMLRAGNANGDATVKYNDANGDVAAMVNRVGAQTQSLIPQAYADEDLNMDGYIKLNGANNDRVFLLNVVGFFTPFFVITEQLP